MSARQNQYTFENIVVKKIVNMSDLNNKNVKCNVCKNQLDIGDYLDSFFPYDNYYNHCKECWKIKIKNNDTKMKWQ